MDRRKQEIEDWEAEQARLKGQAERLRSLEEAEKATEKAEAEKGGADNAGAVKPDKPESGQATKAPFAPAPAAKSDQVGANGPLPGAPKPPPRPKPRPTQVEPAPGKLY